QVNRSTRLVNSKQPLSMIQSNTGTHFSMLAHASYCDLHGAASSAMQCLHDWIKAGSALPSPAPASLSGANASGDVSTHSVTTGPVRTRKSETRRRFI